MSSRLFVTHVVDKAKVIKHWYAKPVRSDISISGVIFTIIVIRVETFWWVVVFIMSYKDVSWNYLHKFDHPKVPNIGLRFFFEWWIGI